MKLAYAVASLLSAGLVSAVAGCGGCKKDKVEPTEADTGPGATAVGEEKELSAKESYKVDVKWPASCAAGQPCEATVTVSSVGSFKVNPEYPHKVVPQKDLPGVVFEPSQFTSVDKHTGTVRVRFRADAGTAKVAGTLKLSVCNDKTCYIEEEPVAFEVPVS